MKKKMLDISYKICFVSDNFNLKFCGIVKPFMWFLFMQLFLQTNLFIFVFKIIIFGNYFQPSLDKGMNFYFAFRWLYTYYLCMSII